MVNKSILIGRIGKTPELTVLDSGQNKCTFSLATSESYKDKAGEWQESTEWHNIVVWGDSATRAMKLAKGTLLYVEGKTTNRSWVNKEGQTVYRTEVVAKTFKVMDKSTTRELVGVDASDDASDDMPF